MITRRTLIAASLLWGLGALVYLAAETMAAHAYPGYSYAQDYISLLGEPATAQAIGSPFAGIMNFGLIAEGILYAVATLLAFLAISPGNGRKPLLALGLIHGIGIVLVGIFHGGQPALNIFPIHALGAFMAIAGGNLASLYFPIACRRLNLGAAVAVTSPLLGLIGLSSLVLLGLNIKQGRPFIFPHGVWERGSVYAINTWELFVAATLAYFTRTGSVTAASVVD